MSIESVVDPGYTNAVDARLKSRTAYIDYQMHEARRALAFLSQFVDVKNARILEIGAGHGGKSIAYALQGMNVTALDVDIEALTLGVREAHERNAQINFLAGDGEQLAFPNDSFDAILLDSVIEHVRNPLAVLRECYRVVKRGGIVFVVFPPFYGPLSGHIDDYVMIPWFHVLPRNAVKRYLLSIKERRGFLTSHDAHAVYMTLNGLTVLKFKRMARRAGFRFDYFRVRPFLTHPGMRLIARLVVAIRQPRRLANLRDALARARREFNLSTFLLFLLLSALAPLVFVPLLREAAAGGCKTVLRKSQ